MRSFWVSGLAAIFAMIVQPAAAQGLYGHEEIYNEPTNVNLGGRWVVADISLHADKAAAQKGRLRLALVTEVTKFIEETETDLQNWIAANREECGQRWTAGDPVIAFPDGAIQFSLDLDLEVWNCGWNGKATPSRLAHEAGEIEVTLEPYVEDGKLQAKLIDFSATEREGLSKYLPLEFVVRQVLNNELKKLNNNPKFYAPPKPLIDEGFDYESLVGRVEEDGSVIITARYQGRGGEDVFDTLVTRVRAEGLTQ